MHLRIDSFSFAPIRKILPSYMVFFHRLISSIKCNVIRVIYMLNVINHVMFDTSMNICDSSHKKGLMRPDGISRIRTSTSWRRYTCMIFRGIAF